LARIQSELIGNEFFGANGKRANPSRERQRQRITSRFNVLQNEFASSVWPSLNVIIKNFGVKTGVRLTIIASTGVASRGRSTSSRYPGRSKVGGVWPVTMEYAPAMASSRTAICQPNAFSRRQQR